MIGAAPLANKWGISFIRDKILIVDDIAVNRIVLREILLDDYDVVEAEDGEGALRVLFGSKKLPQAILLDIVLPGIDGFEVLRRIQAEPRTSRIPVLFITAADARENESRGLKEGAADYISKPFNPDVVKTRLDNQIQLAKYRLSLESMVREKTEEIARIHETVLETLATIIEYRGLETGAPVHYSCELARLLVERMLKTPKYGHHLLDNHYESIIKAVSLHDIGKVAIPDTILLKKGTLTPEEFEVVKQHTEIGADIIDRIAASVSDDAMYLHHCRDICRYHHERWDGKGYPDGIAGEVIPLSARIVAAIDVYDALVSKRCYKPAFTHDQAMDLLRQGAGTQFDPNVIELISDLQEDFRLVEQDMGRFELGRGEKIYPF